MQSHESDLELSVVIPAYNEEGVIVQSIRTIIAELITRPSVQWEIICVNDGSSDRTGVLLDQIAQNDARVRVIHHRRNFGQGRALQTAFYLCRGGIIVTLDADLSYSPDHIYRLTQALHEQNVDIAVASPYMPGGTVSNVPFYRYILSRIANYYLSKMSDYKIATSTCVVRAYRREVLDSVSLTSDGMELLIEVLMKAAIMGFHVCEVPAHLAWPRTDAAQTHSRRASKMHILQTSRMYLMWGWLYKPTQVVILFSLFLLVPGTYLALLVLWRLASLTWAYLSQGLLQALASALREVYTQFPGTVVVSGILVILGIQLLVFALFFLQAKFYFEELYKLGQLRGHPRQKH